MTIELNDNETRILLEIINIAVKAVGVEAAEAGLHFTKMIKDAAAKQAAASEPAQEAA